jgi:ubiquinol-cytochrome c reductase cytochrome b subunit
LDRRRLPSADDARNGVHRQVLRFDQDAYWGLGIGASVMGRMPFIGTPLVHLMLGGPIIAGETLSRFFAIHVFIVPGEC